MKVRLYGTRADFAEATRRLLEVLDVVAVSDPYPDRGASVLVRVYLEVRLETADPAPVDRDTPGGSPDPSSPPGGPGRRSRGKVAGR